MSLNLVNLLLLVNFVSGFRLELMYILLIISIRSHLAHSSPWLHRNHFFCLYQQNKSESKVKFRQSSNCCKRVLKAAQLAYANKTNESITSQKHGSHDFWQTANSVLNKGKSAIPPLKKQKLYGSFLWMGFNCLRATEPLQGGSLLFTTKFPEISGTHLIDLRRMNG